MAEDDLYQERLLSNNALFRSLVYMRYQKEIGSDNLEGAFNPFIPDSHYLDFEKSKKEISNIKLFLQQQPDDFQVGQDGQSFLKKHIFQFLTENQIVFQAKSLPSTMDIQTRAMVLARIYLLQLYKEEGRKLMLMDKNEEDDEENRKRRENLQRVQQIEKNREGQLVEDDVLLEQVYRILDWIDVKMNTIAFEQFRAKNGDRAHEVKKSLQKLKQNVFSESNAMQKLKILISYKYKKGW